MAKKWTPFYNVDAGVGKACPNQSADVLLVQYFLRELGSHPDFFNSNQPSKPCAVDGFYGPNTQAWIDWFQGLVKANGLSVSADGRVDPARNSDNDDLSTISKTRYTITHMNGSFRRRFRTRHDHLESDAKVPPTLRAKFTSDENPK